MSESQKAAVVEALHVLQERLSAAHLAGATAADGELAHDFNTLLQQAKEQFPTSDTLRLIEGLGPGASVPVLAVRLVMMRRTLEAALAEGEHAPPPLAVDPAAVERRPTDERRRWERRDVAWPVQFLFGEGASVAARAVDASRHGLRLVLDGTGAQAQLTHGQKCGVEVQLGGSAARFFRFAEVSHVDEHGIGLTIPEALPASLVPPGGATSPARPARSAGLATRLRGFVLGLRGW